jgi:hypothetical protein
MIEPRLHIFLQGLELLTASFAPPAQIAIREAACPIVLRELERGDAVARARLAATEKKD